MSNTPLDRPSLAVPMQAPLRDDPASIAGERIERLRAELGGKAVPAAVWEDAQRQLAGMLAALSEFEVRDEAPATSAPPASSAAPPHSTAPASGPVRRAGEKDELASLSLAELSQRLRSRALSPVEVVRHQLDRIDRYDGALRSFITVTAEAALAAAEMAEQEIAAGRYRGPLHGVPLAAKDLYATRGERTTCGSRILADWVPESDSVAVAAWRSAGSAMLGKNTLHEFAFGGTSVNEHTGTPRNPWNPAHMCGGSSGGSAAAVAAGFVFGALGSETGNSVRRPASFCGVVGVKPTFGRLSRTGVFPLAWSLDHVGVFARTVADAATLLAPLCGFDVADPGSRRPPAIQDDPVAAVQPQPNLRGQRAGVPRTLLQGIDPEVMAAFEGALDALRQAGMEVRDVELLVASRWTAVASSGVMHAEAAAVHYPWLRERPQDYGPDVLARLLAGRALGARAYAHAQALRGAVAEDLHGCLQQVDVLLAPSTPAPAPPLQAGAYVPGDAPWGTQPNAFQLQRLFSATGAPCASVPTGLSSNGLPMGVQIGGAPWEESLVLGVAAAIEASVADYPRVAPLASA